MSEPNDGYAPRFGPRVRTYEQEYQADIDRLERELAEREAECARLRAERAEYSNALCVLLDHIELGELGVLENDIDWLARLVESFSKCAVSDPAGTSPSEEK